MLSQDSHLGSIDFTTHSHNHCRTWFQEAFEEFEVQWGDRHHPQTYKRVNEGETRGNYNEDETNLLLGSKLDH